LLLGIRTLGKIDDDGYGDQTLFYQQTLQAVLGAESDALLHMRSDGQLSNEVMHPSCTNSTSRSHG